MRPPSLISIPQSVSLAPLLYGSREVHWCIAPCAGVISLINDVVVPFQSLITEARFPS